MKIGILSGAYPPQHDGIGDHTQRFASELSKNHELTIFTSFGPASECQNGIQIVRNFSPNKPGSILNFQSNLLGNKFDELLVQYNPFSFGKRGFNPWLIQLLWKWKHHHPSSRLSVLFHETMVPPSDWRNLAMLSFQLPQFAALCRMADRIFVTTDRWTNQVQKFSKTKAFHLPVGSNLKASNISREAARKKLDLSERTRILSLFGSAHVSRMLNWVHASAEQCAIHFPDIRMLYVGEDGKEVSSFCPKSVRFIDCGRVEADQVGDFLVASDIMLSPFIDGLSTRRGSVMAAFQNGVPVLSTFTKWTDSILMGQESLGIHLSPVNAGKEVFAQLAVTNLMEPGDIAQNTALKSFYSHNFDWPALTEIYLNQVRSHHSLPCE